MNKLTDQFQEDSRASLAQLKDRLENVLTRIELESLQVSISPAVRSALGQSDFASLYVEQSEIMDSLLFQKNSNNLVEEIIFYERASDVVLSNAYGSSALERFPQKDIIKGVFSMKTQGGWSYSPGIGPDGCLTYVRQLPVMKVGEPQGALLIHVKVDALRKQLFNSNPFSLNQSLLVMDSDKRIMLHSSDNAMIGQAAGKTPILQRILSQGRANEFLLLKDEPEELLTMFHRTALGRSYIMMMPEQEMTKQLAWIGALIAISVLSCLSIGILLTYLSSKAVYSPIDKLSRYGERLRSAQAGKSSGSKGNEIEFIHSCLTYLNEQAESLDRYVKKIQPDLRDQFMIKLLKSSGPFNPEWAGPYLQLYRIPQKGTFVVMIVKVDNLFKEKRFLPNEGAIISFAVKNVMLELLEGRTGVNGYVVDHEEKENVAILHFQENAVPYEIQKVLRLYADEVCSSLKKYMSFTVSVGVGGERSEISQLPESYKEARLALQSRLLYDVHSVLFYEAGADSTERITAFNYPGKLEEDLIEALLRGELPSAESALALFSVNIRASDSYNTVMQCYHILLSSIIQSLEHQGYGVIDNLGSNLFEQLKQRQTSQEVQEWFVEILFPLYQHITEEFRANAMQYAIRRVCQHIEVNQGVPSLVECAELVQLSPSYLSRIFKKETGVSFIEYVMEFKIEKAKKLLAETDYSISEIAEIVGYSERNLNRAFQRHVLVSPKQYRMSTR
jgi:AraC-like DNA-binding protein